MKRFLQSILQEIMKKKIILGTSDDAWLMSHSSQRPSVLYWRLSDFRLNYFLSLLRMMLHFWTILLDHLSYLTKVQRVCDPKLAVKWLETYFEVFCHPYTFNELLWGVGIGQVPDQTLKVTSIQKVKMNWRWWHFSSIS